MDSMKITVLETFHPKFCCVCTQNGATFYLKIFENVIVYRAEYISIAQIINETLGLSIQQDSVHFQEICENCKTKLIDFFIFKKRNEEARKIFKESSAFESGGVKKMLLEVVDQIDSNSLVELTEEAPQINSCDTESIVDDEVKEEFVEDDFDVTENNESEEVKSIKDENNAPLENDEAMDTFDDDNFEADSHTETEFLDDEDSETLQSQSTTTTIESRRKSNRQAKPETWLRNKRKLAKNTGKSYYASNGKFVEAKEMKCDCGQSCRMQCSKKIDKENRLGNFNYFYSLGCIESQRKFLFEHMKTYEPKRSKLPKNPQKLRAVQRCYFLDLKHENGATELLQVCKLMFLNTFAISSQMIDTLYRKAINEGRFSDIRGKFERRR